MNVTSVYFKRFHLEVFEVVTVGKFADARNFALCYVFIFICMYLYGV